MPYRTMSTGQMHKLGTTTEIEFSACIGAALNALEAEGWALHSVTPSFGTTRSEPSGLQQKVTVEPIYIFTRLT